MSGVTPDEIHRIARLAALDVAYDALPLLTQQITRILECVSQLDAVDLDQAADPRPQADGLPPLRPDVPRPAQLHVPLADNAPAVHDGLFLVPRVPVLEDE